MSHVAESLIATGTPNNLFTRAIWRVCYRTFKTGVYVTAFCTRKSPLEVAESLLKKLEDHNAKS